jgi:hypothetical protein
VKAKSIPSHFCSRLLQLCAAPILLAVLLLGLPIASRAQDTGYISGTVTDNSGAAISGAKVTIVSTTGNITRDTTTNDDGAYVVPGLPGASYDLSITAAGFQKYTAKKIALSVGEKARVDVILKVGAITEEVIVSGDSVAQVETESSEISSTITGKQVDKLELNGRNFTQLVTLTPGVVSQTFQDEGAVGVNGNVSYSINGGRSEYNNWEIDGGDNMDNGSNTTLNVYPNLEAIAEFKVLTSTYGAQYGRNGSGTVEVETKSGTSSFHGSAFEYLRNDLFNATPWVNGNQGGGKPPYKKHDFGYTVGGPVYIPHLYNPSKQKTFFFWSQEWRREKNPSSVTAQDVPSAAERAGDFSDQCPAFTGGTFSTATFPDCPFTAVTTAGVATPFLNNTVPVTATGATLATLIPLPNTTSGTNALGAAIPAYANTISLPTTWREELIRVDHNLSDTEHLTFRYIHDSWKTVTNQPLWGVNTSNFDNVNTNFAGPGTSFVARLTSNFSPTLTNEFVASYTADHINLTATGATSVNLPAGFVMGSLFDNGFGGKIPAISVSGNAAYGGGFAQDTGYFPWKNANPTYTYRDNVTKIFGNHTLQFGAYFAAAQKNQENSVDVQGLLSFSSTSPNSSGNAFADLLIGNIGGYTQNNQQVIYYDRYKILEPYLQDDWRITKRLTLNLGLRWSIFGRYQDNLNQEFNFSTAAYSAAAAPKIDAFGAVTGTAGAIIPGSGNQFDGLVQCGVGSVPRGCQSNKLVNPAPRVGFAWDPKGDGKMAIRGGYGIFFEHTNGNEANAEVLQQGLSPNILSATSPSVTGYANIGVGTGAAAPIFPASAFSIPDQVQWPYVEQWNLNIQKELPSHLVVSVAYVGSKGTHLTDQRDLNQLHPTPGADNPFTPGTTLTTANCPATTDGFGNPISGNYTFDANGVPTAANVPGVGLVTGQAASNVFVACGNTLTAQLRPFAGYGRIERVESSGNSIYNALQVTANRTVGDLTLSLAYTYSHSIDDSSDRADGGFTDSYNIRGSRASSSFDQRHAASISYVYALPFFKEQGFKHTLLGGWQLSGITVLQSGTPLVDGGTNVVANTSQTAFPDSAGVINAVGTASVPDVVGNPSQGIAAAQAAAAAGGVPGPLLYNPAAFALPTALTFGNLPRNNLYMPGRVNFDFGTFKRFQFKERYAFEFRWENFNVFNHTEYNSVDETYDCSVTMGPTGAACIASSSFLHLNGTHFPRIMQFGLRFQF